MSLYVNAYTVINDGCPIAISVESADQVEIVCGWKPSQVFEFILQREALRAMVEVCTEALEEMDARAAANTVAG